MICKDVYPDGGTTKLSLTQDVEQEYTRSSLKNGFILFATENMALKKKKNNQPVLTQVLAHLLRKKNSWHTRGRFLGFSFNTISL